MTARTHRQGAGIVRVLGVALILSGLLLLIGYTVATMREIALIEAAFGELATGAGRDAMLPRLLVVDGIALASVVAGVLLLLADRKHRRGSAGPTVRPIAPHEVDEAAAVVLAGYRALLDDLDEGYAVDLADVGSRVEHAEVLVAEEGGRLIGCVTYVPGPGRYAEFDDADAAGIRMLAVDPVAQGRGVGLALIRACIDRARGAGRARIVLHSTEQMASAQRLYEREGFTRTPARDWEPEPGLRLLGYELDLGAGGGDVR